MNKKEKELPLPRVIEIRYSERDYWIKRVVFMFKNNKAICWNAETLEEAEEITEVRAWETWREIEEKIEPTYRPFTWEERDMLRGKWFREKCDVKKERLIINVYESREGELFIYDGSVAMNVKNLFENYTFLDGTPCGVKVE